jgi:DNA-binding YbaB/EbfC family protein
MGTGFSKQKKQAKMMHQQIAELQAKMENVEAIGTAGNGLVTIVLTGENAVKSIKIKPECVDAEDIEGLEALIKAAFTDAQNKIKSQMPQMPNMPF